jgi:hypothetical protein
MNKTKYNKIIYNKIIYKINKKVFLFLILILIYF